MGTARETRRCPGAAGDTLPAPAAVGDTSPRGASTDSLEELPGRCLPRHLSALSLAVGTMRCPVCSCMLWLPCAACSADERLRWVRAAQACSRRLILSSCVFVFTPFPGKGLRFPLSSEDGGCAATHTRGAWSCPARLASHKECFGPGSARSYRSPPPPPPPRLSHDIWETHAAYLKEFVTLHSSCQALTSSKYAPISCLGKDSPTLNLLITRFPWCSAASWHSPHQSGPGPFTRPHGYLSFLILLCQPRDRPGDRPLIQYSRQCQLPWTSSEQGGELLVGDCGVEKSTLEAGWATRSQPAFPSWLQGPEVTSPRKLF